MNTYKLKQKNKFNLKNKLKHVSKKLKNNEPKLKYKNVDSENDRTEYEGKDINSYIKNKNDYEDPNDTEVSEDSDVESEAQDIHEDTSDNKLSPQLKLQDDLSGMSFGDLISLKSKLGTKVFNSAAFKERRGEKVEIQCASLLTNQRKISKQKPLEVSSKLRGRKKRGPFSKMHVARDPRFEEVCGDFKEKLFEKSYSFIEDIKQREKIKLVKKAQKEPDGEAKNKINALLKRMKQQETSKQQRKEEKESERKRRKEEREKVSQGKKPYFYKKSVQRKMREEEKEEGWAQTGGLQKHLKRKEKKLLAKDRKKFSFL